VEQIQQQPDVSRSARMEQPWTQTTLRLAWLRHYNSLLLALPWLQPSAQVIHYAKCWLMAHVAIKLVLLNLQPTVLFRRIPEIGLLMPVILMELCALMPIPSLSSVQRRAIWILMTHTPGRVLAVHVKFAQRLSNWW
jgi:hypothetical protein